MASWICDPFGRMVHLNERARKLLGRCEEGLPCYKATRGRDAEGRLACRPDCEVMRRAKRSEEIEPVLLQIGGDAAREWHLIIHIPLYAPDGSGPWLLHCACDVDRARRTEEYVARIASRSEFLEAESPDMPSPRELEILDLLAEDKDPKEIARDLHISATTVRNHIQHLLPKLGAHSIPEAVARHILGKSSEAP